MANEFNINESALDAVLAEVTGEIAEMLRKDEAALMKAADGAPDDEPAESSEGSSGPADPVDDGGADDAAPPDEGSAPPMGDEGSAPAPGPEDGAMPPDAGQEQAIEPAPTVEELQAEYSQLDPEALKMHYLACKAAIMAAMGGGAEASAGAPPAPAAPPAPPAPAPGPEMSAGAPPALKGELSAGKKIGGDGQANGGQVKGGKMAKSETEVELDNLKVQVAAQAEQLKKSEETMIKLAELVAKPLRKSIKGLSDLAFVAKDDSTDKKSPAAGLTKNEIVGKLREKSRDEKLSKSDRALITEYTVGTNPDVSKIEHLLSAVK